MKKSLLTIAILSAVSGAAFAQTNVTVYGTFRQAAELIKPSGAPLAENSFRVTDNDSAFGLRGTEDLGNGMSAWFQVESSIAPDLGPGGLGSRNTAVGLRGGFGEFMLGKWDFYDNDHESIMDTAPGRASQATKSRALLSKFNGTQISNRLNNVVAYTTPNFSGFTGRLQYSAGHGSEANGTTAPNIGADQQHLGVTLRYVNGPIGVGFSHYREDDVAAAVAGTVTPLNNLNYRGNKVYGAYTLPSKTKLGLAWERLEVQNYGASITTAGANTAERDAFAFTVAQQIGNSHHLFGSFGVARDTEGTGALAGNNSGAKYMQLTYAYDFSKRTNLHVTYARVSNSAAGRYDFHSGGAAVLGATGTGADPTAMQIGVVHRF